jgi:uncharacterized circularly permuted ATP-grasp superfamily protein/uncharacterized alpha-E superfamily protein
VKDTVQSELLLETTTQPSWWANERYASLASGRDECLQAAGAFRPAWQKVVDAVNTLGADELDKRQTDARRLLRENGVTYTVYGDPHGRNRVWELDPVPLVIDAQDWASIESGLRQRAELLNLMLADLYGPRRLIREGVLPAMLIHAHPGFLRACDAVKISGQQQLLMYAADLARGQDGRMWVYADRTQVPTGAGYALENRMVTARVMPGELRDNKAQRLSTFFRQFSVALQKFAQHRREDPCIVVLTPGPGNETYFEHAYFASYMGYPLVQGGDLLVRDNRVWLKSLDGLKQVDVILRRVDDAWCDPLELREDSILGVSGLLNAARSGNVVLVNPLGSGVLEARALLPFLDACAQFFLKQDLSLSSVATWWCGQPSELSHVLANLDKLVIKTAYSGGISWFGPRLSSEERQQLAARIRARPADYVGQEYARFSTAPALVAPGRIEPRHMMFRGFLCADGKGYNVMPGGLTRVARDTGGLFISNQEGGVSKDTWVLTDDASRQVRPHRLVEVPAASQHDGRLPSRAAENLFWVGRYAERTEGVARLLRIALDKLADCEYFADECDVAVLQRVLRSLTALSASFPGFIGEGAEKRIAAPYEELSTLARDRERRGSLAETLGFLVNAAYGVRDLWFGDTWRTVGSIVDAAERLQRPVSRLSDLHVALDRVVASLTAFAGITAESMRHDHAWVLLDLGRRVERTVQQASLLEECLVRPLPEDAEPFLVEALLSSSESLMAQRRRFRHSSKLHSALDLLVLDEQHPRSLAYQFERMLKRVAILPHSSSRRQEYTGERYSPIEKQVIEGATLIKLASIRQLSDAAGDNGDRESLKQLLHKLRGLMWRLSLDLSDLYFSHTPGVRHLMPSLTLPQA